MMMQRMTRPLSVALSKGVGCPPKRSCVGVAIAAAIQSGTELLGGTLEQAYPQNSLRQASPQGKQCAALMPATKMQ